jgi:hypothetical protein
MNDHKQSDVIKLTSYKIMKTSSFLCKSLLVCHGTKGLFILHYGPLISDS